MFQNGTCAILVKLSAIINIVEMFCDGRSLRTEKVSYLLLSEPDSFFLGIHLYFEADVLVGLVEDYLGVCGLYLAIAVGTHRCVRFCVVSYPLNLNGTKTAPVLWGESGKNSKNSRCFSELYGYVAVLSPVFTRASS
jgi:hypothetical protein